jgi:2-polyprenyl-3-methyl-5-hydroxy-6-metoxy-1,4-benzoquinol methylase
MDYLTANRRLWNERVNAHMASSFYDNESFIAGRNTLNDIELKLLGDVTGKGILHLQCHFGQDSLSLARMGAKVTGVDLSDVAIEQARKLNQQLELDAEFICSDVLQLADHHSGQYDIVFASYGVIGWHPDINRFMQVVAHFLKPEGQFLLVEFHPVIWMLDQQLENISYSYFNLEPIVETSTESYTDGSDLSEPLQEYGWNHSLSEVFNAGFANGLTLTHFDEYDFSPYNCFQGMVTTETGYQIAGKERMLPLVYSLVMEKSNQTGSPSKSRTGQGKGLSSQT